LAAEWNERKHMGRWAWVKNQFNAKLHHSKTPMTAHWITLHEKEILSELAKTAGGTPSSQV
jgi:hypothetical protein